MNNSEKGLMKVAGIAESEVAWSNIYSYYMDPCNDPEYASAFTNALLELCDLEPSEVLPDSNYCVRTEVATTNSLGKKSSSRIDILIEGVKSIIIENKINHILNNPLNEYWEYSINPAVLVVLTISRLSMPELDAYCRKLENGSRIKCVNVTHYDLIARTKELLGKDFENIVLKELESIIIEKTIIMSNNLYIKNHEERIKVNEIFEQESRRRESIARECMNLKAFDKRNQMPIITFKSCPNNNWIHFRYREQDDLVIGVMCAYLWDWERYEEDRQRRIRRDESDLSNRPVITLFVQVQDALYREMKRKKNLMVETNGYDIPGKFCHVMDYDIDMTDAPEKFCRTGELASFLTEILHDSKKCRLLKVAEDIYNEFISKTDFIDSDKERLIEIQKERMKNEEEI